MAHAAVLIGSSNADVGMEAGIRILTDGGSALDAVEAVIRLVEDNPDDHTVGYGGFPNRDGVVELDALIMDGTSRDAGAVGALRDYRAAITVARAVLERTEHVLIVGDGACELASSVGLEPESLLTDEAERVWRDGLATRTSADPERAGGTVDVLALDREGNLVAGVSTSGWAWKHPGRLGDSPIVGAGGYADSRAGAAACTGWGELALRTGTARMVVAAIEHGRPVGDAAQRALRDLLTIDTGGRAPLMHVVALGADGAHAGASTEPDRTYLHWGHGMSDFATLPREMVTA
jgi:beta-aspartyl-peptidase (threonine type)